MDWPENGEPARFADIVEPLMEAFKQGATWNMKTSMLTADIPWVGLPSPSDAHVNGSPKQRLSAEWRKHDREQGRNFLCTIISIAVSLGVEQGRRRERADWQPTLALIETTLKMASHQLERLSEGRE